MQQYVGEFFSKEFIYKHVLLLDDEEIKSMKDAITKETAAGEIDPDKESDNNND